MLAATIKTHLLGPLR